MWLVVIDVSVSYSSTRTLEHVAVKFILIHFGFMRLVKLVELLVYQIHAPNYGKTPHHFCAAVDRWFLP